MTATSTTQFRVGDTVRRHSSAFIDHYQVGCDPFKVVGFSGSSGEFILDEHREYHHHDSLELVERHKGTASGTVVPPVEEYATPESQRVEALIRQAEDLQAVLRRRNEVITSQNAQITELNKKLETSESYAEALSEFGIKDFLEGMAAVELGASALQVGIDSPEKLVQAVKAANTATPADELDAMLTEFHDAFGVGVNFAGHDDRGNADADLLTRQHMLQEEVNELLLAIVEGDEVGTADALADIIYIAAGTNQTLDIPTMKVLRVVHAANMRKLGPDGAPVPHATVPGKIGKPEGWYGPEDEIRRILKEAGAL